MDKNNRVIIAGAGPVGLICALALARQNIPVLVIESEPALTVDLRAGSFHPPTLELLDSLGVAAKMHEIGIAVPRWQIRDRREGVIAEWDLSLLKDETPFPHRLHMEQHRLTPIVHAMLKEFPHVELRFSARFTKLEQDADGVTVHVESTEEIEHHLRGAWLIGADGGRSQVRRSLGVEFEGFTWPERYVVISTPYDLQPHGYTYNAYIADPDEWVALFKMPDKGPPGLWRLVFPFGQELSESQVLDEAEVEARMQRFLPRPGARYDVPYKSIYGVHQRVATEFRVGRALLAGDAAHINNPLGAFGLNSGIHDAMNLTGKLAAVINEGADASLLDRYVRQRRSTNIEYVQTHSIRNKQMLEERDPAEKKKNYDEIRRAAGDPKLTREYLLNSSMIASVRHAASIE